MKNKIFTFLFLFFSIGSAVFSQTVNVTIVYTGAQVQGCCNICAADYWCINNAVGCGSPAACDNKSFLDPIPAGNIITSVTVKYFGAGCNATAEPTYINGVAVGSAPGNANCSCGACDEYPTDTTSFLCSTLPGYTYGGNNTFTCCPNAAFCPQRAVVTFTYAPPGAGPSIAPASITASAGSVCGSQSTTLSVVGGLLGTAASWNWFSGSCGGTPVGTGASIVVSPTATTTYFVRAQGACDTTTCASVTVTFNISSVAPLSASASPDTTCGGPTTLSLAGGSLGSGASWNWYSGSCGGTFEGTGSSITVSPASTTTYFVRAQGVCNTTVCAPIMVKVNAVPVVTANPASATICSGSTTSIALISTVPSSTFSWTVSQTGVTGALADSVSTIAQTLTASGTSSGTAVYTITPAANGCIGTPINLTVTVNPIPVALAAPASQTICSGTAIAVVLSSNLPGTTFAWTTSQTLVSGGAAGSGSAISDVLSATGSASGTAVYTIIPTANGCSPAPLTVNVTVDPIPAATASPSTQTICSGAAIGVVLNSDVPGTTFAWTVSQTAVSGGISGSGSAITDVLSTLGSTIGSALYTITPTANGCSAPPLTATISVNPIPVATTTPALQTICSGSATSVILTSNVTGTTFAWTVSQTGVVGASAGSGSSITQTLTASGTISGTTVYTITPVANGCSGIPINVTVTVNPNPVISASPTAQTICSGTAIGVILSSNISGTTFAWTVSQTLVSGGNIGSGSTIAGILSTTGSSLGSAVYTVTPTANGCSAAPLTVTITVNPSPVAIATPASPTLCSGNTTSITLSSSTSGTTYTWTVSQTGLTGAADGSGSTIVQTLTASGTSSGTAVYTITPAANGCVGAPIIVTVTVDPIPVVTAAPATQTICSGTAISFALSSNIPGTTFAWTVSQMGATGASAGSGSTIAQTLTASGTSQGSAVYSITPTSNSCVGTPINATVTVNPIPVAAATPSTQTICSGTGIAIILTSNVPGTTFAWTVSETDVSGGTSGSGSTITGTLTATGGSAGTAVYTVTPTANGCSPAPVPITITVNADTAATVTATPASAALCSGSTTSIALSSLTPGTTFSWTVSQIGVTGTSAGSGSAIGQTLTASGTAIGTAIYTITPTANGCAGTAIDVTVTVNPIPVAAAAPTVQTICSGTAIGVGLSSNVPGTTFSWTVSQTNVTGGTNSSGSTITGTLSATGGTNGTAVYTITPLANGCSPAPLTVTITVKPDPGATGTASPAAPTICSGTATSIALSSLAAGTTFSWTVSQIGVTGAAVGSGATIGQTLTASSTSAGTATYVVASTANGCAGTPINVTVTVNPIPVATANPSTQTICSGTAIVVVLSSNLPGTTYAWAISQTAVSGGISGTGSPITGTLTATGPATGTAVYTITPTSNGCSSVPVTSTVTVRPNPGSTATATPAAPTICSGSATSIALSSLTTGTTYAWTVSQTSVTGASAGSGSTIAQTLTTLFSFQGTAVYTITPTANGCVGTPFNVTVTVNPIPSSSYSSQTICSGSAISIGLSSNVAGTTFAWTVLQTAVSGGSSGSGSTIAATLTATGGTNGSAVYTITPTAAGCTGPPSTASIDVRLDPLATASPLTQTICSGIAMGVYLNSNISGTAFTWTVLQTGVSGGISSTGSNGTTITDTLSTTGGISGTAVYTITPVANGCSPAPLTVTITVDPLIGPRATATPSSSSLCSGSTTSIALTSTIPGTTYSWTVSQPGISGASAGSGSSIAHLLTTTGTSQGYAYYNISSVSPNGCSGNQIYATVNVHPIPIAIATPISQTICSGTKDSIILSSLTIGSTFAWTVSQAGVTGASAGSGSTILQTLTASGTVAGTVDYTITPTGNTCIGSPIHVIVTVNPIPIVTATPSAPTICSGTATALVLSSNIAGTTYAWTVSQTGVIGALAGSGSSIAQTLTASGITPGSAIYKITPTLNSCPGNFLNTTVIINPVPVATAAPSIQSICSGAAIGVVLNSNIPGTTFAWTVSETGVSGGSNSSGSTITGTLTATGSANGTDVYSVTATSNGCSPAPLTVTVTVKPNPGSTATATPVSSTICSGTATSIALSSLTAGTTFARTVVQTGVTGASAGTGSTIVQTLTASGTSPGTAVYTITPTANSCAGTPLNATVTVNPIPVATATPSTQTICSGIAINVVLNSNIPGTTFAWTVSQTSVSGGSIGSGSSITNTLSTTGNVIGTAVYTITPTSNGCSSTPLTVTITVNPIPVITATPATQTICSGAATAIALSSTVAGTTFAWTISQTGVSGAAAGSGSTIAQALTTTGASPGSVVYTITPTANGCSGTPVIVTITVNPIPVVTASPSTQSVCSGTAIALGLTSTVAGSTFAWTVSQTGVTGAALGSGSTIAQTLSASGTAQGTAVYTITPAANGCSGSPINVTITVNPIPVASASPSTQTICSGTAIAVALSSNLTGTAFAWTVLQADVSGGTNSSGSTITGTLNTTGVVVGTADYTITATKNGCSPTPIAVTITVNPITGATPIATPAVASLCSGNTTSIALSSLTPGTTFAWTASQIGISGATTGSGATIAETLTTSGTSPGTAVYTITAIANGCAGNQINVTVTVNPIPVATATPTVQTICSGNASSIAISSTTAGTAFSWTVSQTGVTGAVSGTGSTIGQTLTASGASPGTATYTITPAANGCSGTPITVTVTVNPIPVVTATPSAQTICSGTASGIVLSSNVSGTTFAWTVSQTGVVGASTGTGSSIAQNLTASGILPGTATYVITPTANGCVGTPINVVVTVNPTPAATATPSVQTICSGTLIGVALSSNVTGTTFAWTVSQTGVTGGTNSSGSTITGTLSGTGSTNGTAVYTITPTANGCSSSSLTVTITVKPDPGSTATATPASPTICSGSTTSIALSSATSGTTFSWTVSETATTGASAGSGSTISQALIASGTSPGTAVYTITPSANGCTGNITTATVTVDPIPAATATPSAQTICSGTAIAVALSSNVPGTTFAWTLSQTGVSGGVTGSGSSITDLLSATGSTIGTAVYTITPTANSCSAAPLTASIIVNPYPVVTSTPVLSTICSGNATLIALSSPIAGSTFSWAVSQTGVIGASVGTGSAIGQTITASGITAGTAVYTITPSANGCIGTPINATVTINPSPVGTATPSSQTICSGTAIASVLSSNVPGTTFAWTVSETGTLGGTNSSGSSITDLLSATGSVIGNAVYTITPSANGCSGTPFTFMITVDPIPVATTITTAILPSPIICSGNTTSIPINSLTTGATFSWTATETAASGASAGSGSTIAQTLTALGTSAGTAVYSVIPTANGCTGSALTINVIVYPRPIATAAPSTPTICSGSTIAVVLSSDVSGTAFAWTVSQTASAGALAAAGATISQTLTASGTSPGTAVYTITPTANSCTGTPINVTVTVNPIPVATLAPTAQTICSGTATGVVLSSNVTGTAFAWTVTQTSAIGALSGGGSSIVQTLANSGISQDTAVYTITPTANGCMGNPINATITVNPIPVATATLSTQTICSGTPIAVTLSSNITGTTFVWTVLQTDVSGGTNGTGSIITDALSATGGTIGSGVYTVTPTVNGCSAAPLTVSITVNPIPVATATPASQTICSGITSTIGLSSDVSGTTFAWTASQSGLSGASSGSGSTITETLTTTGTVTGIATYDVTLTANGCNSAVIIVPVTVNPIPLATVTSTGQTICSGSITSIALTSNVQGTTFNWTAVQTGVSGANNASDSIIAEMLTVTGAAPGNVLYTITSTANGCSSIIFDTVIVAEDLSIAVNLPILCIGDTAVLIATAGFSYLWSTGSTTNSITDTPIVSTSYTVTGTYGGCADTAIATVTAGTILAITVNSLTICVGQTATLIAEGASSYLWSTGSVANPFIVGPDSTTSYTVTGSSPGNCPGISASIVTVKPLPVVTFNANVISGCAPLCVIFVESSTVVGGNITSWNWSFGGDGISSTQNPEHCFNDPGQYPITLTVISNNGCSSSLTDTNVINIDSYPVAAFTAPLSSSILESTVSFTNNSIGAISWAWNFGDALDLINDSSTLESPAHSYSEAGTYCATLLVTNTLGCVDSNQVCFIINPDFTFYLPNSFSPNGDGINDEFYCKGDYIGKFEMSIFNRWGELVFYSTDINDHWNGKADGGNVAIQDVYVYSIVLRDYNDKKFKHRGKVTIVK